MGVHNNPNAQHTDQRQPPTTPVQSEVPGNFQEWLVEIDKLVKKNKTSKTREVSPSEQNSISKAAGSDARITAADKIGAGRPPDLPPPSQSDLPGGMQGTGNPWLQPNPIAVFSRIILEVLKVQMEQKFDESIRHANLTEKGMEVAKAKAKAIIKTGELEARELRMQAATSFATAAIAITSASAQLGSAQHAKSEVKSQSRKFESNSEFKKLGGNQDQPYTKAYNQYHDKKQLLETKQGELANARTPKEIAKKEAEVNKLEKEVEKIKPGYKDIENYKQEQTRSSENPPDKVTQKKLDDADKLGKSQITKQKEWDEKFEQNVANKQQINSNFITSLNQGLSGISTGVGQVIQAQVKIQIAEQRAYLETLNQGSNIINEAMSGTKEGKQVAHEVFQTLIQFLEKAQAAQTQNFGYTGGRAH